MKEFIWQWIFWASVVFCGLLALSLIAAYGLYSTAPANSYTPVFAAGFGFFLGFFGLGAVTLFALDKFSKTTLLFKEVENEFFNKVIRESPFFFFSLMYFFSLSLYMGFFMLVLNYIKSSCI
ncbi:MAG: hypothetical protein PHV05_11910 [Candidatus Riflebacteria bacterium]|nr:hypothetical protein [Candidatus Riflebacteria bacterium]